MQISFSPMRSDVPLTLSVKGNVLVLNGEELDVSALPKGATLPRDAVGCEWLASDIERDDSGLILTLVLPHGAQAPEETLFPAPLIITTDGPVPLPPYEIAPPDYAEEPAP